jgi:hypothetical protein
MESAIKLALCAGLLVAAACAGCRQKEAVETVSGWTFFEQSLLAPRRYKTTAAYYYPLLKKHDQAGAIRLVQEDTYSTTFDANHLLRPGEPAGLSLVEKEFGIRLPEDINEFYKRWGGGLLVFRREYELLAPGEMVRLARELRQIRGEPADLPWRLIRFCDIGDSCYFALRLSEKNEWEVIYADVSYYDADLQSGGAQGQCYTHTDASFRDWLKRMADTDGWPTTQGGDKYETILTERMGIGH